MWRGLKSYRFSQVIHPIFTRYFPLLPIFRKVRVVLTAWPLPICLSYPKIRKIGKNGENRGKIEEISGESRLNHNTKIEVRNMKLKENEKVKIEFVTKENLIKGNLYLMPEKCQDEARTWLLQYKGRSENDEYIFKPVAIVDGDREHFKQWKDGRSVFCIPEYDLRILLPRNDSDSVLDLIKEF